MRTVRARQKFTSRRSFRTSVEQNALIKERAEQTGISEADLIRIAIDRFLSQPPEVIKSIYDTTPDV